jgi:ribosomal protein S27AE
MEFCPHNPIKLLLLSYIPPIQGSAQCRLPHKYVGRLSDSSDIRIDSIRFSPLDQKDREGDRKQGHQEELDSKLSEEVDAPTLSTEIAVRAGDPGYISIPDEENQNLAGESRHTNFISSTVAVSSNKQPNVVRSASLDALVPSPPTPMKHVESDPVTSAEKLEAQTQCRSLADKSTDSLQGADDMRSSFSGSLRQLLNISRLRSSSLLSAPRLSLDTFYCKVCLENCSVSLGFVMANCSSQHKYCRDCLAGYYTALVNDGSIELFCPGIGEGCNGSLQADELRSLVNGDVFERHARFVQVKKNPLYRECPSCSFGVTVLEQTAKIVCGSCQAEYCFFHANAHVGTTCEQYARAQSRRTRDEASSSDGYISRNTRRCPHCNTATEKNGGCNHM